MVNGLEPGVAFFSSPFANSSNEVVKRLLKSPQDVLFDLRMDGIEVGIGLFLKDQQSCLIFVRSGYAFAVLGILAISKCFIPKMPTGFQHYG